VTTADSLPATVVVDASVAVKWILPEDDSEQARAILEASAEGAFDLIAPEHVLAEAANAVWARSYLRKEISVLSAQLGVALLRSANVAYTPTEALIPQAFELALAHGWTVYDCLYVALAMQEDAVLVTADRPVATTFGPTGYVRRLADFDIASTPT
jgi:predicted nucleic acid-binding protein